MSSNAEKKTSLGDQLPDSIQSKTFDKAITANTDEDASQVDYLGTTFVGQDWGPDPFDSDSHDDLKTWGDDLAFDDDAGGEHPHSAEKVEKKHHKENPSWGDDFSSIDQKKPKK